MFGSFYSGVVFGAGDKVLHLHPCISPFRLLLCGPGESWGMYLFGRQDRAGASEWWPICLLGSGSSSVLEQVVCFPEVSGLNPGITA